MVVREDSYDWVVVREDSCDDWQTGQRDEGGPKGGRKEPVKPRQARLYFVQAKRAEFKAANPQAESKEIVSVLLLFFRCILDLSWSQHFRSCFGVFCRQNS